jgi:hypothetical protein
VVSGREPGCARAAGVAVTAVLAFAPGAAPARAPGEPVRVVWEEGDVGGFSTVYDAEGTVPIGHVEYRQTRDGDRLTCARVTRFLDGSSDEDVVEARVGGVLEAVSGRSLVRDPDGTVVAELVVDVAGGRVRGRWGRGDERRESDERVALSPGTYWGPLIFLVLKNFDANAVGDRLVFRTVAPTPRPMVLDMVIVRGKEAPLAAARGGVLARRMDLRPTVNWLVDPMLRWVVPDTTFFVVRGEPPALARFIGPRNYARQPVRIE